MGNKLRKIKKKQAANLLKKTGGIPPVTLAVADPILAFTNLIPSGSSAPSTHITLNSAIQKILKDVSKNRPKKGPLKKVKLQPKKTLMERLMLRKDESGRIVMEIVPGDPIATLDGKPFVRRTKVEENAVEEEEVVVE
jgi:hypothetical protein